MPQSLAWSALLVLACASCESSECDGGPISDLPNHCKSPDDSYTGGDTGGDGTDGTAGGGDGYDPGAESPGQDASAGDSEGSDAGIDGGSCAARAPVCAGAAELIDVSGELEGEPVQLDRAALIYRGGLTNGTGLRLTGTRGGEPVAIQIELAVDGSGTEPWVAPPGVYETTDGGFEVRASWSGCDGIEQPLAVAFEITAHTLVSVDEAGQGQLTGELRVQQDGSSLTVPLDVDRACDFFNSP